jgi:hypothetical protein
MVMGKACACWMPWGKGLVIVGNVIRSRAIFASGSEVYHPG